ncbi:hypothetical protein F3087_04765 [Nocardia colli]|uniref:Uncharacterized protein n=1 Tax=Nocardia colli TaxID=2545717 RepID=A0A5N0ENM1_9NOCA|nr:hypothetical protein [Nocardia colli]KAA8890583.1 hypothetical protein F3087_04765 [Nocardia colli]
MTTGRARQGTIWCAEDYQLLIDALRQDLPDEEVAEHTERTLSAVRKRASVILDDAYQPTEALRALRRIVSDPDYDWETTVRGAHARMNLPYWDACADERLILGWAAEHPPAMADLIRELDATEDAIARRCLWLELTDNRAEVVNRFGAAPGGALAAHARLARDKTSVELGVLVVTAATGRVVHLSLHPTPEAAVTHGRGLAAAQLDDEPATWTIGNRIVGEGPARTTMTGVWGDWPAAANTTPSPAAQTTPAWRRLLRRH